MDTNANLDDILGVTSDDIKNEEPVQKERKKPGPKPKAEKESEVTNEKEPDLTKEEIKVDTASELEVDKPADTTQPEITEDKDKEDKAKNNDHPNTEDKEGTTSVVKSNVLCEFKNPVVFFRGPNCNLPLCTVYFVKLSGRIVGDYAECYSSIPEIGQIHGYVYADVKIRKLLSNMH